jgi:hypothetical protein
MPTQTIAAVRRRERDRGRAVVERLEALAAPVLEIDKAAEILARAELVAAGDRAEDGDPEAKRELRRAVKEFAPGVIARCSNIARTYRWVVADTAAGRNLLVQEAMVERAARMVGEIAGENPSPLEVLLAERIASLWVLVELQEALLSATYRRGQENPVGPAYLIQMSRILESATRRHLAAIKTLAQVRKLQANTPSLQQNVQINVQR